MEIIQKYSHMNGFEYLMYHKKTLWENIIEIICSVNAETCFTKKSKEIRMKDRMLLSPKDLNTEFKKHFQGSSWSEKRISSLIFITTIFS